MDKNQTIGLLLISLLLLVYFYFFAPKPEPPVQQITDTTSVTQTSPKSTEEELQKVEQADLPANDSIEALIAQQQLVSFIRVPTESSKILQSRTRILRSPLTVRVELLRK